MRASEIVENASIGASTAGGIAPVAMPLGGMLARNAGSFFAGANTTDEFPNTPYKKKKKSKFQNSL
jgi:hypothetical protein